MCGIAGILNLDGRPCDPETVRAFADALFHRGPDGGGVHVDGPVGLGHRRLAILDLSDHGKQPLSDDDGRFWITYNGEIFNFLELRKELEQDGHRFRTESDTEVILAAYKRWGADCLPKFNGMWAFAIWDSAKRELFISRDRFGVKPFRYLLDGKRFAFASETKAFLKLDGYTPRENVEEMQNSLARGGISMEGTVLEGVKRLPGGYNMLVKADGTVKKWRWWRTIDHLPEVPKTFKEQAEQFRALFFDAVRVRLRSDVPVATALSGGLDSSSIVCTIPELAKNAGEREARDCHHAFIASFPGTLWDESEYAMEAVAQAKAEAHTIVIDPEMVVENLEQYCFDIEMSGDRLSIPLWLTYRALRRNGVVVSLDGHGADEMLAGYARAFQHTLKAEGNLLTQPARTMDLARTLHGIFGSGLAGEKSLSDIVINSDPTLRAGRDFVGRASRAINRRLGSSAASDFTPKSGPSAWAPRVPEITYADQDTLDIVERLGPLKAYLYKDFHATTLVNVLRTFDRCSMAHGVEIRMPFMDWRLVSYVFALPDDSIAGDGYTKRVLREAMRGILPEKIRTRRGKIGFSSPLADWFNGGLGDWVWREVQTPAFVKSERWNGPAIRDFVKAHHAKRDWTQNDAQDVWRFVQAHRWRVAAGHT